MRRLYSIIRSGLRVILFPVLWLVKPYRFDEKWINKFSDWFGGSVGFKQQTFLMMLWTEGALQGWIHDPHMLIIMAALTIYSAITQPILAKVGTRTSSLIIEQNERIRQLQEINIHQTQALLDVVTRLHELEQHDAAMLSDVVEHITEDWEAITCVHDDTGA